MGEIMTITAEVFAETCDEIFDRLAAGDLARVNIIKMGRVIAVAHPPPGAYVGGE